MKPTLVRSAALALAAALAASACSDIETRVNRPGDDEPRFDIFFQVSSEQAPGTAAASPGFQVQLDDDAGNNLSFTEGQLVVREMELGRNTGECLDASDPDEDDGDACTEITVDPQLLALPVDRTEIQIVNQFPVASGTYDRLQFDVQVATQQNAPNLLANNPGFQGNSMILRGSYNGQTFAVELDLETSMSLEFPQSIQTEAGATSRITLVAEMGGWFRREDGSLIDPAELANDPALEDRVESQIASSFSIQLGPPQ